MSSFFIIMSLFNLSMWIDMHLSAPQPVQVYNDFQVQFHVDPYYLYYPSITPARGYDFSAKIEHGSLTLVETPFLYEKTDDTIILDWVYRAEVPYSSYFVFRASQEGVYSVDIVWASVLRGGVEMLKGYNGCEVNVVPEPHLLFFAFLLFLRRKRCC